VLLKIPSKNIFQKDYGWHSGRFHFSFGDYEDSTNQAFGVLCAFNDFIVQPKSGFDTHPHEEMEIISFCVSGTLKHQDNMNHVNELHCGDSQYTCTGSGIMHSEKNEDSSTPLRFLQIWIKPRLAELDPLYRDMKYIPASKHGLFRQIVSGNKVEGVMQIAQDANVFTAEIDENQMVVYKNRDDRQSYAVCLEGEFSANGFSMIENDAMKLWGQESINFIARKNSHLIVVEMARV
jgi:redox-sensitive bicupin YhaK (pirin superfamily)